MTPQFKTAVLTYGPRFMSDLGLSAFQVAGIFGNFAVESDQFRALQEYKPTVKGSRGGWGWAQWTGPRRKAFEAWADAAGYKRDDPEAFYQFTLVELRGPEKAALAALRRTVSAESAAESFMRRYERPGVPHLPRRKAFALEALALLPGEAPRPKPRAPSARVAAPPAAETVEKVSSSPKGVLSGLWALLQGKPPVPQAERSAVRAEVREERPDLAKDLGGLRLAGLGTLGASVLGGTADSGLLDTLKQSADGVRDTSTSVKEFADLVIGFIRWGVAHWWIFGLAIGVYMLFRVGWAVFRVYSYVQQRRAIEAALNKGK